MGCLYYNYIDKRQPYRTMDERAEIDGRTYADNEMLPLHSLDVAFSQKMHTMSPLTRVHF